MTNPLAVLLKDVPRFDAFDGDFKQSEQGSWLTHASVLAALEAAPVPDLVEAGKVADWLKNKGAWDIEVDGQPDAPIRSLIALATAQAAQIAGLTKEAESWRSDYRSLEKAIVGDTGLSAMTVATQARLFRPRAEAAEAERDEALEWLSASQGYIADAVFALDKQEKAEAEAATLRDEVERLRGALQWCSGSDDFQDGGKAREGWLKLCAPLLHGEGKA